MFLVFLARKTAKQQNFKTKRALTKSSPNDFPNFFKRMSRMHCGNWFLDYVPSFWCNLVWRPEALPYRLSCRNALRQRSKLANGWKTDRKTRGKRDDLINFNQMLFETHQALSQMTEKLLCYDFTTSFNVITMSSCSSYMLIFNKIPHNVFAVIE